jgi:hypothetical protein
MMEEMIDAIGLLSGLRKRDLELIDKLLDQ